MISLKEIHSDIDSKEFFKGLRYSINLMWINSHKDDEGEYVCSGKTRETINYVSNQLKKWRIANPEAEVNFWYDSQCTNTNAIENTQRLLKKVSVEAHSAIKLRDIREIPFVQNNSDLFLSGIPIYFRVDFLKLILSAHLMESKKQGSVIYTDLSICDSEETALTKQELYNPIVLKDLEKFGIVLGEDTHRNIENQFLQMMNTPELLESLKHAINSSLLLATNSLNLAIQRNNITPLMYLYYAPFNATMGSVSVYYQAIQSKNPIKIRGDVVNEGNKNEWINYEPEKHGYILFGNMPKGVEIGNLYYDCVTRTTLPIEAMTKLPEGLCFSPDVAQGASRNDINPGTKGRSHQWYGELPLPMQGDEFHCTFWPLNSVPPHEIENIAATEGGYEMGNSVIVQNQSQKYRETVLNRRSDVSTSETLGDDKQDKINKSESN